MHLSFGKSVYVAGTSRELLDKIEESSVSISATGDELVVITKEAIDEYLERYKNMSNYYRVLNRPVGEFLIDALKNIEEKNDDSPIGDIFFTT